MVSKSKNVQINKTRNSALTKDDGIPPLRDLWVPTHQPGVDVRLLAQTPAALNPDLLAEVENGVHDCGGDRSERKTVRQREDGGKEQRRVGFVLLDIDSRIRCKNTGDVVPVVGVVVRPSGGDRHVRGVPYVVEVESGCDDPEEEDEPYGHVGFSPPRSSQR